MGACLVDASDEQPDAVGPFAVYLRGGLGAVADLGNDAFERDGAVEGHFRGEGLLLHEVGEDARVGGEAGEGEAEMGVYADDFFLVGGEFFGVSLGERLIESVRGNYIEMVYTFNATSTVCVLLAIPTTTDPCLTASDAYSTWKIRPCGELVTL